jgi:signal transduction histidine kinase
VDRDHVYALLRSDDSGERLKAARVLESGALPEDLNVIREALRRESVSWIRAALSRALHSLTAAVENPVGSEEESDEMATEIYEKAVKDTTSMLVHELRHIVARLKMAAMTDLADYVGSETGKEIQHLSEFLSALFEMNAAASPLIIEEFDLANVTLEIADQEARRVPVNVELAGPFPLLCKSDKKLVALILSNALRNAIEAVSAQVKDGESRDAKITINWGETDSDFWLVVLDEGPGLPLSFGKLFAIGASTKPGHLGMGLTLARQAAEALGGKVRISPRRSHGTSFELRWPKTV